MVYLNSKYLKLMSEALDKFGKDSMVRLEVRDNMSAVQFKTRNAETDQEFLGLILPVESSNPDEFKSVGAV